MPPEFLTRYAGVFFDVHIFPPKRHSNFQSVGIIGWHYGAGSDFLTLAIDKNHSGPVHT